MFISSSPQPRKEPFGEQHGMLRVFFNLLVQKKTWKSNEELTDWLLRGMLISKALSERVCPSSRKLFSVLFMVFTWSLS